MTTQVIFKIDKKLKEKAVKKARKEGISLTAFYKHATERYVEDDLRVGLVQGPEIPNARTARLLERIDKDVKAGKNLSPGFDNAEDAIRYLKDYVRVNGN